MNKDQATRDREAAEKYAPLFKGTNFGSTRFDELIFDGLEKVALGFWNGSTMQSILLEVGYVEQRHDCQKLTKAGLKELFLLHERQNTSDEVRELKSAHEATVRIVGGIIDRFTPEAIAMPSQRDGNLAMIELMHCFGRSRKALAKFEAATKGDGDEK